MPFGTAKVLHFFEIKAFFLILCEILSKELVVSGVNRWNMSGLQINNSYFVQPQNFAAPQKNNIKPFQTTSNNFKPSGRCEPRLNNLKSNQTIIN